MLKNFLFIFILIFIGLNAEAQKASLSGKIFSIDTGEPVPGASVFLNNNIAAISNMEGRFDILANPGNYTLRISMISFADTILEITLNENRPLQIQVGLKSEARELDLIVISAGKFEQKIEEITVSMEVLRPELVEARNTTTMEDAMNYIPGVNIVDGQANIRGGSGWTYGAGSRVQILVDDLPMLAADANDTKWTFLPVENLEQVEVIKGASSVLFGSSALNGVINIRTAYPKAEPMTKINVYHGAYDKAVIEFDSTFTVNTPSGPVQQTEKLSYPQNWWGSIPQFYHGFNFLHSRKIGQFDIVSGGNIFIDEGYRRGEYEQRARFSLNTRYRFRNPDRMSAGINLNTITTNGSLFFVWKNDTSGAFIPADNTLSAYTTYRTNADPYITYFDKKGNSHKLRTRWFNTTNQNNTNQNSTANLYYGEYQYQHRFGQYLLLTSGFVRQQSLVKSELYGDHDGSQTALYSQADIKWKKFNFSLGGRVEQNKVDSVKDSWTPVFRSGLNIELTEGINFRISYGQGYRFPSIAEKFIRTNVGNLVIYPNNDLEAENGYSMEAGLRQMIQSGKFSGFLDLAVFENRYDNMMEFVFGQWGTFTDPLIGNGFRSINVGDTRIRGFEISSQVQLKVSESTIIRAITGYTFLDPRQLTYDSLYVAKVGTSNFMGSDSSDFLKYRYKHLLKADLEIEWKRFNIGATYRYNSRMVNIDKIFISGLLDIAFPPGLGIGHYRNLNPGGSHTWDLRSSYRTGNYLTLSFIIKNALNRLHMERPGDMQPPRTFVLQAGLKF
ncbi:MAG: TonB-dependent receptor [Bacteroidetes bacterium]|nr:MAG: TonB-dependent receptor [Bacteroidota bacterium]REK03401.1 MAG: TonB-dependent receptor [Bacteroidota bacterium]REK34487.1 MAG: TonB-dependent receptor [Bacteroidota bacterium]REK50395.1 MAG: TonB-dependent receptor [Bacteroidota bacterium]